MATKRYSSPCARFTVNVKADGKQQAIVFDRYNPDEKRRFVDVADKRIQEQMEKSPDFTVYFRLDYVFNDEPEVVETPIVPIPSIEAKEVVETQKEEQAENLLSSKKLRASTLTEAKKLINDLGVPFHRLTNKERVIKEASQLGYELEFVNN